MNNNNHDKRSYLVRGVAGCAVSAIALLGVTVTPATAERFHPDDGAAAVTMDIVESVRERRLQIAADRVARPEAYGSTWRG